MNFYLPNVKNMKKINTKFQSICLMTVSTLLSSIAFSQSSSIIPHAQQPISSGTITKLSPNNIVVPVQTGSFPINSTGQHCVSDQVMDAYLEANGLKAQFQAQYEQMLHEIEYNQPIDKANYTIPVIFHVIRLT